MIKRQIDLIEAEMRRSFLSESAAAPEPPEWQRDTMNGIIAESRLTAKNDYLFSPRQEKIIWKTAWISLLAVLTLSIGYFWMHHDAGDIGLDSLAIAEIEEGWDY